VAKLTQVQLAQNIAVGIHDFRTMISDLVIIMGTILFWLAIIWFIVNLIRYLNKKNKARVKLKFKLPLFLFIISIFLTFLSIWIDHIL
jgi:hypothetical protein